jgi:hypothetical protein
MKKLLISVVAILISVVANSQIISLQFFQCQEIVKTESDTIVSDIYNVNLNYIFDLNENIISTTINGMFLQETITVYSNTDNVITLVYTENASAGWILNLDKKLATYFEIHVNSDKELIIINPILF